MGMPFVRCVVALALVGSGLCSGAAQSLEQREIPFELGDDSSSWALDDECDDPRFTGEGMSVVPDMDSLGTDASDCRTAFASGTIEASPLFLEPKRPRDIVWGDDEGTFANDGECDDVRFTGYYARGMTFLTEDIGHDATDCRKAFVKGIARWRGAALPD